MAMKSLLHFTVSLLLIINIFSCSKENDTDKSNTDSIPLFYQKLDSNTTSFKLPDSSTIYYSTYTVTFYAGPHPYERTNTVIETSDTLLLLCCGKYYYNADIEIDSVINNNLYWISNVYISYNFSLTEHISVLPKYIGLRCRHGERINYGWAHCYNGTFVEYAIDTSSMNLGEVKAGRKYKYYSKL